MGAFKGLDSCRHFRPGGQVGSSSSASCKDLKSSPSSRVRFRRQGRPAELAALTPAYQYVKAIDFSACVVGEGPTASGMTPGTFRNSRARAVGSFMVKCYKGGGVGRAGIL